MPNLNSRGTSKPANQSVYYISGSIYHWFALFPGKISCSICGQSHHIWKTKAPNNSKTAGSRYFSARVVNTSGVLSARIPGYQQESAILFLRTIGMFLAYIPVIFAVYLKDIDTLGALRSVAIISLLYYFIRPSFPWNMYGVDGNRSRCSAFWDDLMSCVEQVGRNDQWKKCQNEREDYFECLHHKKLVWNETYLFKDKLWGLDLELFLGDSD